MLILQTKNRDEVLKRYNNLMTILQNIQTRDKYFSILEQYKLYLNLILTQLNRFKEKEKYTNLTNRLNELQNYFCAEVI